MLEESRVEKIIENVGETLEEPSVETKNQRILSLDFIRGFAIFLMVIFHSFLRIGNINWVFDMDLLFQQNIVVIIGVMLIGYLGSFAGLFLLISIAVNIYSSIKKLEKGNHPDKILLKQLIVGILVIAIAYFTEMILCHEGLLGRTVILNPLKDATPGLDKFTVALRRGFHFETLHAIGWGIIIIGIINYFIVLRPRYKGKENLIKPLIIFISLFIAICIITPFLQQFISNNYEGFPGEEGEDYGGKQWQYPPASIRDGFLRLFLVLIAGNLEPLFPFLGTAALGAVIGLCLAQKNPPKRLPLWMFISSIIILLPGLIYSIVIQDLRITYSRPTIDYYFIALFGQLITLTFFLWFVEFRGHTKWFTKISQYWRRWGIISLSIYSFEIFGAIPRHLLHLITKWDIVQYQSCDIYWQIIVTTLVVVIFWELLIRLWELINFIGSWEWIIASLTAIGKKLPPSSRLDVKKILYNVEPITFKV